jgi:pimeloyl-ACP methyl ester carboxylesterase
MLVAGSMATPESIDAAVRLSECSLPGVTRPARCGTLEVAENPDRPEGRRLAIGLAVIPAAGATARPDPIVVLMGGPGEDAIGAAEIFARQFASLLKDRDLLLVDQRGTGRSGPLHCALFSPDQAEASLRDVFPVAAIEKCARTLAALADLTQYGFNRFAADLEHVRQALGYGALNVFAGSYGTRAAQAYVREYPESVRTLYLGSAVPVDARSPLAFAKTEEAALDRMLDACAAQSACNAAFPGLRDEFREVSARVASGPISVTPTGASSPVLLHHGRVAEWFRAKLYRPYSSTALPWLIHRAFQGDWIPIANGILADARENDSDFSFGLFFAITCSEDVAFIREPDIAPQTKGTFLGDYRIRQQQAACKYWPRAALPPHYREPVRSAVPTVFASGDADGGTPLWYTDEVARGFSHRQEVLLRGQGHTEWNDCIAGIYERLVTAGVVDVPAKSTCGPVPRPPFRTN